MRVVNTSDADIVSVSSSPDVTAVVAWKPQLSEISAMQGAHLVFDSSSIPGEIIDTLSVNTEVLAANPNLGKALVGAWYEIMQLMSTTDGDRQSRARRDGRGVRHRPCGLRGAARDHADVLHAGRRQKFATVAQLRETMDSVRQFAFEHGLLGENASSADFVGIGFADGSVLGNPNNVRLRFNADYVKLAAEGKL